jgi:Zn-finger nucleic acid-binding protein
MDCPRGCGPLSAAQHHGIEMDQCAVCDGRWLDLNELDRLEATRAPDPSDRSGMVTYSKRTSELNCPVCAKPMTAFNYRANPLELDVCESHGYWLDAGEEGRVRDFIEQRVRDLYRASTAEESWGRFVTGLKDRLKGKGR